MNELVFIIVHDKEQCKLLININSISVICEQAGFIVVNGVFGDGNGMLRIDDKDMKELIKLLEGRIIKQ